MEGFTALAVAALVLILAQPPLPVARLRDLTRPFTIKPPPQNVQGRDGFNAGGVTRSVQNRPREEVDVAIQLDLLAVSLRMGSPIPAALSAVGTAVGGKRGAGLARVAAHLSLGASWDAAWNHVPADLELAPVKAALAPAWLSGAPVAALLEHGKRRLRQRQAARNRVAAKRLGVKLIAPVAVCFLPAFIALGLLPVVLVLMQQGFSFL